jgi:hypothetical protein
MVSLGAKFVSEARGREVVRGNMGGGVGYIFAISAGLVKIFNIASDIVCVRRVEDRGITRRR